MAAAPQWPRPICRRAGSQTSHSPFVRDHARGDLLYQYPQRLELGEQEIGECDGHQHRHPESERDDELAEWAGALRGLEPQVETVFGYFNNQFQGHSPYSVRELQKALGQEVIEPMAVRPQSELF